MSDCERVALARLRQRIVRSTHSALAATSSHFDENHSAISAILSRTLQGASESTVPDELMRFGGENILVFSSLVLYPSEVREVAPEFLAEKSFSESAAQSVVIDTSKIPVPRASSRPTSSRYVIRNYFDVPNDYTL